MALPYTSGGTRVADRHNFVSFYEAHEPDISDVNVRRYGTETLMGLMDIGGVKAPTHNQEYSHFEKNRVYPKIKAHNSNTSGSNGGEVTFDVVADAQTSLSNNSPYDTGVSTTNDSLPVRQNDLIQLKPASGTIAAAGNYINCVVTSVSPSGGSNGQFKAQPIDDSESIPAIASGSEQEIFRYGNLHGEGSTHPLGFSTRSTKFTNQLQIIKDTKRITGTENLQKKWFTEEINGVEYPRFMIYGEADAYVSFMNAIDAVCLIGEGISNTALATKFQDGTIGTDNPVTATKGLIPEILSRGNTHNYSSVTGITVSDFEDIVETLEKQKGSMENFLFNGIALDLDIDREMRDTFQNGGINYGAYNFDEEKKVALNFSSFKVGSYVFHKRNFRTFNDLQTFGAEGYGYSEEGMIIPAGTTTDPQSGAQVPVLRKRYLEGNERNREMRVEWIDKFAQTQDGQDMEEIRYLAHVGFELFAANTTTYLKKG